MTEKKKFHSWLPFTPVKNSLTIPKVISSNGIYLKQEDGREVMDMISSWWVSVHGHAHPKIAKAIADQAAKLEQVIYANFTHDPALILQEKLGKILPDGLNAFFFSDNGSTAVEVALKMAYQYWQNIGQNSRTKFLSFENGYHGDTLGAMSVSGRSIFTKTFNGLMFSDVTYLPFPDNWIGDEMVEEKEEHVLSKLKLILEKDSKSYAALIMEPLIQGAGGMKMCRPVFLQKLEKLLRQHDILIIYDEVMTGFGRTGDWFAATKSQTTPDIICLSKALTGGFLPMSLTVANEKVLKGFESDDPMKTFYHGHSYTANPLGCAAGIASLEIFEKEKNFDKFEGWHLEFLKQFEDDPRIEKARALGTIAAFNLKAEKEGYLNTAGKDIQKRCYEKGLFIRPLGNVVYFMPPYITTKKELANCYEILLDTIPS